MSLLGPSGTESLGQEQQTQNEEQPLILLRNGSPLKDETLMDASLFAQRSLATWLKEPECFTFMVSDTMPTIVRLYRPFTYESRAYRCLLHQFVDIEELPSENWLVELGAENFRPIPNHRHDWGFSSRLLAGSYRIEEGVDTWNKPPEQMQSKKIDPTSGTTLYTNPLMWHEEFMETSTVYTIMIAARNVYSGPNVAKFRPKFTVVHDDYLRRRQVEKFIPLTREL